MTDISKEAVGKLAAHLRLQSNPTFTKEQAAGTLIALFEQVEQLAAELAEVKAERDRWSFRADAHAARAKGAEAALATWQASQHYRYIGKNGKPVLARDLEDRLEAAVASITDPLANPRVVALVELIACAQQIVDPCYPASHADWQDKARTTLAAIRTGGDT